MSDIMTVDIDTSKANERINELQAAFIGIGQPADLGTLVEDESRLTLMQVIRLTPPKSKAQGENAVSRDLLKLFTPVNEEMLNMIGSEHGVSGIDAWMTSATGKHEHIKWDRIDPTGDGMAQFHRSHRDRRGRARKLKREIQNVWYAPYVVSFGDFADYRKKMLSRVGRRKAAWGKTLVELGGKVAAWISRHVSGARGHSLIIKTPESPSITVGNFAPGILDDERIVRSAFRIRVAAMTKRIKLVTSGYAKDVAMGIKIGRKVQKTPIPEAA